MDPCKPEVIEELSERYERFRNASRKGPSSIDDFLVANHVGHADPRLISELVQIDIQLNWMSWDKQLANLVGRASPEQIHHSLESIPKLHDYKQLVQGQPGTADFSAFQAAAQCEMEARNSWGDAVGLFYYSSKYRLELAADRYHRPICLTYAIDGTSLGRDTPKFELRGRTVIGRQRRKDPLSLFCEQLPLGNRIVVANHADNKISREQLTVQLLNRRYAVVSNLSTLNPVIIANIGTLGSNQSIIMPFDFSVRLPCRRLHFSDPGH